MSMSTHVAGFAPPNERWEQMKAIWDACEKAGIPIPKQVLEFFGGEKPDPAGITVKLEIRNWRDESSQGFEIDLSKVPEHVKTIRFYNSW